MHWAFRMKHPDALRLGPLVFRDPVLLCGSLYFLLYFDASGFLRLGLLAAFLHECGHILVHCALLRRFPVIEVTMTGFCMRMARTKAKDHVSDLLPSRVRFRKSTSGSGHSTSSSCLRQP